MPQQEKKTILFAILDWGLGHATRSVPLIKEKIAEGNNVILASSGNAQVFLQNYFPQLEVIEKPGYHILYFSNKSMMLSMAIQFPKIISAIIRENGWLKKIISKYKITDVISDNCYGAFNKTIHSTFITHQLLIKCPGGFKWLEKIIFRINKYFINRFDHCIVPDNINAPEYSGQLSHLNSGIIKCEFTGIQSRFKNVAEKSCETFEVVAIISGPEPQRTSLENKCSDIFLQIKNKCCIIRGLPDAKIIPDDSFNLKWFNHLNDEELKCILINAKLIICRSGYTTIMDLAELKLTALLIPTPGQTEQEYLADHNSEKNGFKKVNQNEFSIEIINSLLQRPQYFNE